jgi:hypothetical protein
MSKNEVGFDGLALVWALYLQPDLIEVGTGKRQKIPECCSAGDDHRFELHSILADVPQSFDPRPDFCVLHPHSGLRFEYGDDEVVLMSAALSPAMHRAFGMTARMATNDLGQDRRRRS